MHEFVLNFIDRYKKHPFVATFLVIFSFIVTFGLILIPLLVFLFFLIGYYLFYFMKTLGYYKSDEFLSIKSKLDKKIIEYNEFDRFMDETRVYIRQQQALLTTGNFRNSTLTVYKNSILDEYKYIIKYFFINTKIEEQSMQIVEEILQKYNTIDQTYKILSKEYSDLITYIQKNMYRGAYIFHGITMKRLGSRKLPKFVRDYYLVYTFGYTSPANRKNYQNNIVLNDSGLQDFAQYLNALIKYHKTVKYQRQLMTPQLREIILSRDHYKCKYCGVSRDSQSRLLLEVDHIIPISKGGITIESNLQSLCWKCNRDKGAKIINHDVQIA